MDSGEVLAQFGSCRSWPATCPTERRRAGFGPMAPRELEIFEVSRHSSEVFRGLPLAARAVRCREAVAASGKAVVDRRRLYSIRHRLHSHCKVPVSAGAWTRIRCLDLEAHQGREAEVLAEYP